MDVAGSGNNSNRGIKSDDAGAIADAGPVEDAAYCLRQQWLSDCAYGCCGACGTNEFNALNIVNCGIPLKSNPRDIFDVRVYVDCDPVSGPYFGDAGLMLNPQGWTIDYSIDPARLVFGATLCEQLQSMQSVPVYLYYLCTCIT